MKDKDGVYIGIECCHWQGVDRIEDKVCCGGRVRKVFYIRCDKLKVVLAESVCTPACLERTVASEPVKEPVAASEPVPVSVPVPEPVSETISNTVVIKAESLGPSLPEGVVGSSTVTYVVNGVTYRIEAGKNAG